MEKLELKHLAPYLPYGLKVQIYEHIDTVPRFRNDEIDLISSELITFKGRFTSDWYFDDDENEIDIKPILRPFSDVINHSCYESLSNNLRFNIDMLGFPKHLDLKVNDYNILLKNHLDVFGLIEKGLAIDINKLAKTK